MEQLAIYVNVCVWGGGGSKNLYWPLSSSGAQLIHITEHLLCADYHGVLIPSFS